MKQDYPNTTVNDYFAYLEKTLSPHSALGQAAHTYLEQVRTAAEQEMAQDRPFLSIITRTQGKRPLLLRETLLCLTAQSCTDFELLLMGHNLDQAQSDCVAQIISELPPEMRARTRLIPVNGGTRTTPLNEGFAAARGRYIAVLDDDDLVLDHWVESFYELSKKENGKILHTYTILQDWKTLSGQNEGFPYSANSPDDRYFKDFYLLGELRGNSCPLCALAFPAYAFQSWGIHFDEVLTTTEDWDYLMRCAFLCGVADSSEATCVYRYWKNAENSATLHSRAEWDKNYDYITERFDRTPIIMPPHSISHLIGRELNGGNPAQRQLFFDDGGGFFAEKTVPQLPEHRDHTALFGFETPTEVRALRFDPAHFGYLKLGELTLTVEDENGTAEAFPLSAMQTNGVFVDGGDAVAFLLEDPQLILTLPTPRRITRVILDYTVLMIGNEDVVAFARTKRAWSPKRSLVRRALRKGKRILWRVLRKCKRMLCR